MNNGPLLKSQAPRFASVVKALFNSKGASVLDALPFVAPSFELTSELADVRAWKGEFIWSALITGTAAAAQFPSAWLSTLDTSLIIVEQLVIQSSIAQRVRGSIPNTFPTLPAGHIAVVFDDKRVAGNRFSGRQVFSSEAALVAATRFQVNLAAGVPFVFPCKYICCGVRPQGTPAPLLIQGETAGVTSDIIVSARGYGRILEDTELAP